MSVADIIDKPIDFECIQSHNLVKHTWPRLPIRELSYMLLLVVLRQSEIIVHGYVTMYDLTPLQGQLDIFKVGL